jgi:UMF1 family MFS transporter
MLVFMPILGVISDEYKRRMPFLIACTLGSVIFTCLIGITNNLFFGLLFFIPAYFGYQASLVFYDALLPQIAGSTGRVGKVSGYGVALGYVGAIVGLKLVEPFVKHGETIIRSNAFVPTAIFFLLFSMPCFIAVKDDSGVPITRGILKKIKPAFAKLLNTIKNARQYPQMFIFLIANLAYSDAINTIYTFMGIYAVKVIGFQQTELMNFLIVSTTSAVLGSFLWGLITDRWGNKRTMIAILVGWIIALTLTMASQSKAWFWVVGPIAGICLGGVWVTGRSIVVALSPPHMLGEFFGLYGLTEKFTAVFGPLMWGGTTWLFARYGREMLGYRIAVANLLAAIIVGLIIFCFVKIPSKHQYTVHGT